MLASSLLFEQRENLIGVWRGCGHRQMLGRLGTPARRRRRASTFAVLVDGSRKTDRQMHQTGPNSCRFRKLRKQWKYHRFCIRRSRRAEIQTYVSCVSLTFPPTHSLDWLIESMVCCRGSWLQCGSVSSIEVSVGERGQKLLSEGIEHVAGQVAAGSQAEE